MSNIRPKILITIDWFLPGTKSGGPVRSYKNIIDYLGAYYDFYVITRDTDYCSDEVYENITSNAWNKYNDHTSIYYISKDQLNKGNMKSLINEHDYDAIMINGIYSFYFSILPVWLSKKKSNVIVSARGMLNPQAFSVKGTKKRVYLTIAKALGLYKNIKFHATNKEEAGHIKAIFGKRSQVKIAANLPRKIENFRVEKRVLNQPLRLVNVARVSIEKGTLKMIESLQNVKTELVIDIFGPVYDLNYWEKCQISIRELPKNVTVNYRGFIESELVIDTIKAYDFFILLSEGENFGHSILEALSVGCPVIISDKTPWKNLESKGVGWDVDINDSKKISEVFSEISKVNQDEYNEMANRAFIFAKNFSEDQELLNQNKNLFL
ncbi:MAG: glycosyltransferase [Psychroserpens sp.]|uniref:glycosyltransferase n=1 Tax=Psychroserpens sp. TaxID=2020870 RepID=UPI0030011A82